MEQSEAEGTIAAAPGAGAKRGSPAWVHAAEGFLVFGTFHALVLAAAMLLSREMSISVFAGLLLGHAFDLFLDRFYRDEPVWGPVYRCAACRSGFRAMFAFPVLGYIRAAGRCPDCRSALPVRAVFLPAGATALFAASYAVFGELGAGLLGGFFSTIFLALTFTDLERRVLPNRIVYPAILLAIAFSWGWPNTSITGVFIGGGVAVALAAGMLLFSLPFGGEAFGMGDVKMIVLIGFVVGFPAVFVGVLLGTMAAGLFAGFLVVTRIRTMKDYIPHGPFLALGAVFALLAAG